MPKRFTPRRVRTFTTRPQKIMEPTYTNFTSRGGKGYQGRTITPPVTPVPSVVPVNNQAGWFNPFARESGVGAGTAIAPYTPGRNTLLNTPLWQSIRNWWNESYQRHLGYVSPQYGGYYTEPGQSLLQQFINPQPLIPGNIESPVWSRFGYQRYVAPSKYKPFGRAQGIESHGYKSLFNQFSRVKPTKGVLEYTPPVETGGGAGGGYESYTYTPYTPTQYSNPFAEYRQGYAMGGVPSTAAPVMRTAAEQRASYYNNPTIYEKRGLQLLTTWRI